MIQFNHRWTQIDTDSECSELRLGMVRSPPLNGDRSLGTCNGKPGLQNLCSSESICGLHPSGYG